MALKPQLLRGKVMHKRLSPKVNAFTYGIYYASLPLSSLQDADCGFWFGINRKAINSLYNEDHGPRDGSDLLIWMQKILRERGAEAINGEVVLVTMPRTLGYIFNPISFWLCYDSDGILRAVLCEVSNTFGERHNYLCMHEDQREIIAGDLFESDKLFHVSPFLQREGCYTFRFTKTDTAFGAWIDYKDVEGYKKLLTSMTGQLVPWDRKNLSQLFWRYPMVSLRAIMLIHWQALKLFSKGIRYVPKPEQSLHKLSHTRDYK